MTKTGIYQIRNTVNGKIYVGQSVNIKERIAQHKYKAFDKNEPGYRSAIHKAFRKYGVDAFEFSILEECSLEDLDNREKYWIKHLSSATPNGYNILPGGQNSRRESPPTCCVCGKQMHRQSRSMCRSCYRKSTTKNYDFAEIATAVVQCHGFEGAAKKFFVSSNALRKWLKRRGLPYHTRGIVSWYENEFHVCS